MERRESVFMFYFRTFFSLSFFLLLQVFLLVIGLICVPVMLLPKPFLLRRDHMNRVPHTKKGFSQFENESDMSLPSDSAFAADRNTLGVVGVCSCRLFAIV